MAETALIGGSFCLLTLLTQLLYDLPWISGILKSPAPANVDLAVKEIARRDRLKIAPDGIFAANQLGLTNAVPAKNAYILYNGLSKDRH